MNGYDITALCFVIALIFLSIGMFSGFCIAESEIKDNLLKTYKYRIDKNYVINGSVDKELK